MRDPELPVRVDSVFALRAFVEACNGIYPLYFSPFQLPNPRQFQILQIFDACWGLIVVIITQIWVKSDLFFHNYLMVCESINYLGVLKAHYHDLFWWTSIIFSFFFIYSFLFRVFQAYEWSWKRGSCFYPWDYCWQVWRGDSTLCSWIMPKSGDTCDWFFFEKLYYILSLSCLIP